MRLLDWSLIEYQFDKPDAVDPSPTDLDNI